MHVALNGCKFLVYLLSLFPLLLRSRYLTGSRYLYLLIVSINNKIVNFLNVMCDQRMILLNLISHTQIKIVFFFFAIFCTSSLNSEQSNQDLRLALMRCCCYLEHVLCGE